MFITVQEVAAGNQILDRQVVANQAMMVVVMVAAVAAKAVMLEKLLELQHLV